jgi:autophagy-related protein 5
MTEDKEILKEVWNGKLPICFKLSQDECGSAEPEEIYLMVSRQTYFPLVLDKVQRHFAEFLVNQSNKTNEIWLDFNGTPLKWHYPVGLLFDLYANEGSSTNVDSAQSINIPWGLNVHFDNFPAELISTQNSKDIVESYFLSTIKEADAIKHKGKIINDMLKRDHKQLWFGVQNDKFDQFWTVNKKLMEVLDGMDCFRAIPYRIYQNDKAFIQSTFEPVSDTGKKRTLGDLLESVLGGMYKQTVRLVLIQGITPSYETPLQWLSEHLSYPDNFLHICVK